MGGTKQRAGWGRRIVLVGATPSHAEVAAAVRDALPDDKQRPVPAQLSSALPPAMIGAPPPHRTLYDVTPSEELLGLEYRPLAEMVRGSVEAMLESGARCEKPPKM